MGVPVFSYRFKLGTGDLIRAYALVRKGSVPAYVAGTVALFMASLAVISFMRGGIEEVGATFTILLTGRAGLMVYGLVGCLVVFAATSHWIFGAIYALAVSFSPLMRHAVDARIDNDGISLTANGVSSQLQWSSIVSVFDNDAVLACRLWTGQLFILPRRAVPDLAEYGAVRAFVREKYQTRISSTQ
jgi:hypothetical protein